MQWELGCTVNHVAAVMEPVLTCGCWWWACFPFADRGAWTDLIVSLKMLTMCNALINIVFMQHFKLF